jgi:ABC-type polysaccharide transport system permease subunit
MFDLCAPALIYVAFSLTQIIIDTFKGLYNTAFFKVIVMIIITILLNALCQAGMGIISWIIVFIPFIFMSVIVAILLFVFGLDPATGKLNLQCNSNNNSASMQGGNLIYTSTMNSPTMTTTNSTNYETVTTSQPNEKYPPYGSSDPQVNS